MRADLSAKAVAAAKAVNYVGAGTVEFIFDNDTEKFYFMEMYGRCLFALSRQAHDLVIGTHVCRSNILSRR